MWTAVLVGAAACYLLKLAGLAVPERVLADDRVRRIGALLPVALLGALIAVQVFTSGPRLTIDARAVGLAVAVVAQWRRASFLVVVTAACAATALVRALS